MPSLTDSIHPGHSHGPCPMHTCIFRAHPQLKHRGPCRIVPFYVLGEAPFVCLVTCAWGCLPARQLEGHGWQQAVAVHCDADLCSPGLPCSLPDVASTYYQGAERAVLVVVATHLKQCSGGASVGVTKESVQPRPMAVAAVCRAIFLAQYHPRIDRCPVSLLFVRAETRRRGSQTRAFFFKDSDMQGYDGTVLAVFPGVGQIPRRGPGVRQGT